MVKKEMDSLVSAEVSLSWSGYSGLCFGFDELWGGGCVNWLGMGVTVVDSLSTLWLVGEKSEFNRGVDLLCGSFFVSRSILNVFEVTIRVLGGLLSGYGLSGDVRLLHAAELVGHRILSGWRSESFPSNVVGRRQVRYSLAEVGSLQLEFRYLWHVTNRSDIREMIMSRACWVFERLTSSVVGSGLLSASVNNRGESVGHDYHIGGGADSFYEYMLKTHIQDGGRYPCAYKRFKVARDAIRGRLIRDWMNGKMSYLVRLNRFNRVTSRNMDHLDCFAPGMLALDYRTSGDTSVLKDATKLMLGCWQLYNLSSTVGVESVHFGPKKLTIRNPANLLRPEVAESLYYLWKVTGDSKYQIWGDHMLERFKKYSKFNGKYCTMRNVRRPSCDGKMESFWIAETLKYLYLLRHDVIDLDKWVFNTEAHPLPIVPSLPPCACAT